VFAPFSFILYSLNFVALFFWVALVICFKRMGGKQKQELSSLFKYVKSSRRKEEILGWLILNVIISFFSPALTATGFFFSFLFSSFFCFVTIAWRIKFKKYIMSPRIQFSVEPGSSSSTAI
jgi:hypothetical protein